MEDSKKTRDAILLQCRAYPGLEIRDLFKFLYQSSFGCEHMVTASEAVTENIKREYDVMSGRMKDEVEGGLGLIEPLDGAYSRLNLGYMDKGLAPKTLGRLFSASARTEEQGRESLEKKLTEALELAKEGLLPFSCEELEKASEQWRLEGYPSVHHSDAFREAYHPAYRVISNRYVPFMPLFAAIDRGLEKGTLNLAIDGGSASGKTTLGAMLLEIYEECTVFHMDDFFLRPEQRTKERYAEPGGNVDRERFLSEVLLPLEKGGEIEYRRFDCKRLELCPAIRIVPKRLRVIEGAYSMHTELSDHYDLSAFLDISLELQNERIAKRNTPQMAERFFNEWIPYEHKYFDVMRVRERCDLVIEVK